VGTGIVGTCLSYVTISWSSSPTQPLTTCDLVSH
jgi:hypothetical protein